MPSILVKSFGYEEQNSGVPGSVKEADDKELAACVGTQEPESPMGRVIVSKMSTALFRYSFSS